MRYGMHQIVYSAAVLFALFLFGCGNSTPVDTTQAPELPKLADLQQAAAAGNARAQYKLGVIYAKGGEVPQDMKKAFELYEKSAVQGYANAQYALGVMYQKGEGIPRDAQKAVAWYQKAAAQGFASAQHSLGLCYAAGEGVAKDTVLAYAWISLSGASMKDEKIATMRNTLEKEMSPAQLLEAQRLSEAWVKGILLQR